MGQISVWAVFAVGAGAGKSLGRGVAGTGNVGGAPSRYQSLD